MVSDAPPSPAVSRTSEHDEVSISLESAPRLTRIRSITSLAMKESETFTDIAMMEALKNRDNFTDIDVIETSPTELINIPL